MKPFSYLCASLFLALPLLVMAETPDSSLQRLIDGNLRFVAGKSMHKHDREADEDSLVKGQTPFAAIVSCSDSRVPPEFVFDQGLGDLFVVRDAGNVIGPVELDSAEYAAAQLNASLILVLGHQNCGAVIAALKGSSALSTLPAIYPLIEPAIEACSKQGTPLLIDASICNVKNSVKTLKASPVLAHLIKKKKLKIVGGYYSIETRKVTFITE